MTRTPLRWIGVAGVVAIALTGCGTSSPRTTVDTFAPVLSGAAAPSRSDSLVAGAKLATEVISAVRSARTFRVVATSMLKGLTITADMRYGVTGSSGTIKINGGTVQLVRAGVYTFVKAPDAFWQLELSKAQAAAALALIGGKWVRLASGNASLAELIAFTDKQQVIEQLVSNKNPAFMHQGAKTKIGGVQTIPLTDVADGSIIYVAASGTPLPVRAVTGRSSNGTATFSSWNAPFSVQAPPAAQVYVLPVG